MNLVVLVDKQILQTKILRIAFGSVPKDGGTFTFYRNLRPALLSYGIDLRCISVGRDQAYLWEEAYADEGCTLLAPSAVSLKPQARAFADWCEAEQIAIVMGINSGGVLSSFPHLPERIRVMARCANAFDEGYRVTMSGRERLTRIVALSPRLRDDLVRNYGADPSIVHLIPNGIDPARFETAAAQPRGQGARLELGFLGRLEHGQKGVLHLPAIVEALRARNVDFCLRVAGKGRHADQLRQALSEAEAAGQVAFLGALTPDQIPDFLRATDVFAFTSRFEGMPNALLESMMAGAVPVCFNIAGITDFMIEDGRTGHLVAQEDAQGFAEAVAGLAMDRERLDAMHVAVAAEARARFSNEIAAQSYATLFKQIMAEPAPPWTPRPWAEFVPDANFPQTWRRYVPSTVKNWIKRWRGCYTKL